MNSTQLSLIITVLEQSKCRCKSLYWLPAIDSVAFSRRKVVHKAYWDLKIIIIIFIIIVFSQWKPLTNLNVFLFSRSFSYQDNLHYCIPLSWYQVPDQNNPYHQGLGEDLYNNAFESDDQCHKLQNTQTNHPTERTRHYLENN